MSMLKRFLASAFLMVYANITSAAQAQPLPDWSLAELEAAIADKELGKIRAVAIEQAGEAVYRKRFDDEPMGDPVDIKSAGKSITAIAVGMAIDDGALSGIDAKVWPLLGSSRGDAAADITVADLLGMSSALDCNDWERKSPGQEEKMYRRRVWRDFALDLPLREFARDADGDGPFSYCTAGVFLLGQVVQEATGERFDAYVQRRLFDPLGIDGAIWRKSRSGEIQSGGQLTISDDALLKIGRLVLGKGQWQGEQLVSEDWIKHMLTTRHQLGEHVYYSNLWWSIPLRAGGGYTGAVMMKGNGGNMVALVPAYDAVLVVQTENYNKKDAERYAFTAMTTLLGSLEPAAQSAAKP
ncbi:serine hydrolase domain-containing protein [Altererythrobacter lutimaris]|uniref:Serine hydrolase n=1 Tax=Altererythrobacter lutimaris TaxID=2743979 RepID=A0A850H8E1_9SPHN|nr:serine hydrolase [Altererythrobacter lutimaris]NVE95544.1 serine hydrolase [Altererythrobacter lutimaris]